MAMFGFGRDTEKRRKKSKFNRHQRAVANAAKSFGHSGFGLNALASKTWNKDRQTARAGWKEMVKKAVKGRGGSSKGKGHGKGRGKRRGGNGSNLGSFAGMDNYLSRLLGDVKKVIAKRLRPSETLTQKKAKLQELIGKMDRGIAALKDREAIEDRTAAEYREYKEKLRSLQMARTAAVNAWKAAHKKQKGSEQWTGPGDFGGFMSSGDPSRRRGKGRGKKGKKGGKRSKGRRVSAATKKKMKAAARRRWARIRSYQRKGYSLAKARQAAKRDGKKSGKKRSSRDWSGSF